MWRGTVATRAFHAASYTLIVANVIVMCVWKYPQAPTTAITLHNFELAFGSIFVAETFLRACSGGNLQCMTQHNAGLQ